MRYMGYNLQVSAGLSGQDKREQAHFAEYTLSKLLNDP